jgi:hypothetical protein
VNTTKKPARRNLCLTTLCTLAVAACVAWSGAGNAAPSGLAVRDVRTSGASVTGWVQNQTPHEVRDVRLMVENSFLWNDERHPGDDNPGSSHIVRLDQPIPAGGSVEFRYDRPAPLPVRKDGRFETSVKVLSFSEHWTEAPTASLPHTVAP